MENLQQLSLTLNLVYPRYLENVLEVRFQVK